MSSTQVPASYSPPDRLLLGPGPSNADPAVLQAMQHTLVGHLDPTFIGMMEEIKSMLRQIFQTENEMTFPVSATGSAGMEACFVLPKPMFYRCFLYWYLLRQFLDRCLTA